MTVVELLVRPSIDQHVGSDIEFIAAGFGSSVQANWAEASQRHRSHEDRGWAIAVV